MVSCLLRHNTVDYGQTFVPFLFFRLSKIFRKFSPETLVSCDLAVNLYFCSPTFLLITFFITNKYSPHRNTTQNCTPHLFFFYYMFRPYVLAIIRWTVAAGSTPNDLPGTLERLCILVVSFSVTMSTLR
jgi:hypothetical protein